MDDLERLVRIGGQDEHEASNPMAQQLPHPAQFYLRVPPRQDLPSPDTRTAAISSKLSMSAAR